MVDFENYKKLISSHSSISNKKVLVNTPDMHRMCGSIMVGHMSLKIVVECRNYNVGAGMNVYFAIAKDKFNFMDKEYSDLRCKLNDALRPYNTSNNGVFIVGAGIWINNERESFWGLSFNDLNKIDATHNKCANNAIACVNSAIAWFFKQPIYDGVYNLYNYFREKKLLL